MIEDLVENKFIHIFCVYFFCVYILGTHKKCTFFLRLLCEQINYCLFCLEISGFIDTISQILYQK